jgi:uncharacterized protein YeaO (DUF488 family)
MRIYTSYYAKVARASTDALLVQVSNTKPKWFEKDTVILPINVFPDWNLINAFKAGQIDYNAFCAEYRKMLSVRTTPDELLFTLNGIMVAKGKEEAILLCYEKENCHRFELARFLDTDCYAGEL